jgi:hypothetical protein
MEEIIYIEYDRIGVSGNVYYYTENQLVSNPKRFAAKFDKIEVQGNKLICYKNIHPYDIYKISHIIDMENYQVEIN